MLVLDNIHSAYGKIEALKGISLEVNEGEIVTLIGANGAGKSTTLMTICGVNRVKQGTISFKGERIDSLPPHVIVRKGISQAPEGRRIFPRLTVIENLEMGAFVRTDAEAIGKDIEYVFGLFPILRERRQQLGGTLSGGEQQMLAIARALMARPKLLLLDEPSLGLAPIVVAKIFEAIKGLNRQGATIFLVEQNARMALKLAHRGYVLETGRITMNDTAAALLNSRRVQEAYLGA
ncbi:MAG: ABC transporter ATP-binding protein [Planctomycetota bacterium]|nr:ABC transporter ATP-binding protein [Planctomycetota bacterium]